MCSLYFKFFKDLVDCSDFISIVSSSSNYGKFEFKKYFSLFKEVIIVLYILKFYFVNYLDVNRVFFFISLILILYVCIFIIKNIYTLVMI